MKIEILCDEFARDDNYACNKCGGDIRGTLCCDPRHCDVYKDDILQPRPESPKKQTNDNR